MKVAQPDLPEATWKGLPWKVVAIRAVQGHNRAVVENAKISSLVKQVFYPGSTVHKGGPRLCEVAKDELEARLGPDLMASLPRVIYHSCDRLANGEDCRTWVDPWWLASEDWKGTQFLY